jgi:catalase (peroxidase I)
LALQIHFPQLQPWEINMNAEAGCPIRGKVSRAAIVRSMNNELWWPNQLKLDILRQNSELANPMDPDFDYPAAFGKIDLGAVKADIFALMTDSQAWWPADYGHLRPAVHPDGVALGRHLPDSATAAAGPATGRSALRR